MIGRTVHVNRRVTQSGFRAFDFAHAEGRQLNTYVVINLREDVMLGAVTAFSRIRHKFRDWLTYRANKSGLHLPPVYVYVFENPTGSLHVNWAVHVPDGMQAEFRGKLEKWLTRTQGTARPYDINIQPIVPSYAKYLAKYIFKGTDPAYVQHFFLQEVHAPQGSVHGKRAGISQAVGIKARQRANFHPRRSRPYIQPHRATCDAKRGSDDRVGV
jgi:hypothetical protein